MGRLHQESIYQPTDGTLICYMKTQSYETFNTYGIYALGIIISFSVIYALVSLTPL